MKLKSEYLATVAALAFPSAEDKVYWGFINDASSVDGFSLYELNPATGALLREARL